MSSPASSSTNPGPASVSGNDYLGGGTPWYNGTSATALQGFYGATPVAQRATAATHQTSLYSASTYATVATNLTAFIVEVQNTLTGLGIWV